MKKLFCTLIFVLCLTVSAFAYTETFYVCNGGDGSSPESGACATAYDKDDMNDVDNWAAVNAADDLIGPNDIVYFRDDGTGDGTDGHINGGIWVRASGQSGAPITFKNYPGHTPVIRATTPVSGWTIQTDNVYRADIPTAYVKGCLNEAQDARLEMYTAATKPATYADWDDYYFYADANYVYIKDPNKDPDNWNPLPEVGYGYGGIVAYYEDYVVIDGLTIYGPHGASVPKKSKETGGIHNEGGSHWTVRNVTVAHSSGPGISIASGTSTDFTVEDCEVSDSWGGVWSSSGVDYIPTYITISRCYLHDIANKYGDEGDRDAIGVYGGSNILIQDCYITNTSMSGSAPSVGAGIDMANVNGYIIRRNKIVDSGYRGITAGGAWTDVAYGNEIYNNIIIGWGTHCPSNIYTDRSAAIKIGGTADTKSYRTKIYNNLMYDTVGGSGNADQANMMWIGSPGGTPGDTFYEYINITNNLFHCGTACADPQDYYLYVSEGSGDFNPIIAYNYFYLTAGIDVIYTDGGSWNFNELALWESEDSRASDNYNHIAAALDNGDGTDPALDSTTFSPTTGYPVDGGTVIDEVEVRKAIDPSRSWTFPLTGDYITRTTTYSIGPVETSYSTYGALPQGAGVSILSGLSWTKGSGQTDTDVHFKAGSTPCTFVIGDIVDDGDIESVANALLNSGSPLAYGTSYCWDVVVNPDTDDVQNGPYYFTTTTQANPPTRPVGGIVYLKKGPAIGYSKRGSSIK